MASDKAEFLKMLETEYRRATTQERPRQSRNQWEKQFKHIGKANMQLYCRNGHHVGDERDRSKSKRAQYMCSACGSQEFFYSWEL